MLGRFSHRVGAWVIASAVIGASGWAQVAAAEDVPAAAPPQAPCEAPAHTEAEAAAMLEAARAMIQRAGEHPTDADLAALLPLLRGAADAGLLEAQVRYGNYVFGYWATDEMFWPKQREEAVKALAMLRVAALRMRAGSPARTIEDPLLAALSQTPPRWGEDVPEPPRAWVEAAEVEAARWLRCRPDVMAPPP